MSELLTPYGQTDHGPADPLPLDPPGLCPRCKRECRDFTSVGGREFCDSCAEMVRDIKSLFRDCQALGTGEP